MCSGKISVVPEENMEIQKVIGTNCHVCIGCGRCHAVNVGMHILTERPGGKELQTIPVLNTAGERLVTVDVGTTTIAMELYAVDGTVEDRFVKVNPQMVFGADVLSRIQAAVRQENAERLRLMVYEVLREGIRRFKDRISAEETLRMVLAGNTTMVYLLMGWNTEELGRAPFQASHLEPVHTVIEGVPCYIFPGLSAFVGGDVVAGIIADGMTDRKEITLLIDLGTNGEMVLGNQEKLLACSAAAGPAFEGGVNQGIWGADMVSLLAELRRKQILDETGLLQEPYFDEGVRIGNVCVTQKSVRAVQLAKGAVAAGIQILLREYGITEQQVSRVVLAGGFGYYLNPHDAAEIGLLPQKLLPRTIAGGNTALTGALKLGRALLNKENISDYEILHNVECRVDVLNLAEAEGFEEIYLESMGF